MNINLIESNSSFRSLRMKLFLCALLLSSIFAPYQSFAIGETSPDAHKFPAKADSIIALLPQLKGAEKINALINIIGLISGYAEKIHYFRCVFNEACLINDLENAGWALGNLVGQYNSQFDTDSVFIVGEEAIRFMKQHKMYDDIFFVKEQYIRRYLKNERIITALRTAEETYGEAKAMNKTGPMARLLSIIGSIYSDFEHYQEAVNYYNECIETAGKNRVKGDFIYIQSYYNLAWMARYMNQPREIMRYADSLHIEIDRFLKDLPGYNINLFSYFLEFHRAIAYAEMNQPEQTLLAIRRAENLYDSNWSNEYYVMKLDDMYGEYYYSTGKYDTALEHQNRLLEHYKKTSLEVGIYFSEKLMARTYMAKGDTDKAFEIYRKLLQSKESHNQKMFYSQINELRTIYELDKTELEAERRLLVIQRQRYVMIIFVITIVALLLIVSLMLWNRSRIAEKNRGLYRQIREQDRLSEQIKMQQTFHEEEDKLNLVSRLNEYLLRDRNFAKPDVNMDKIADALNISRSYLYRFIRETTGSEKPQEYINGMRLEESRRLLTTTDDLIETIAQQCGYTNARTFYRRFRNKYNITPAEYRKMNREETEK